MAKIRWTCDIRYGVRYNNTGKIEGKNIWEIQELTETPKDDNNFIYEIVKGIEKCRKFKFLKIDPLLDLRIFSRCSNGKDIAESWILNREELGNSLTHIVDYLKQFGAIHLKGGRNTTITLIVSEKIKGQIIDIRDEEDKERDSLERLEKLAKEHIAKESKEIKEKNVIDGIDIREISYIVNRNKKEKYTNTLIVKHYKKEIYRVRAEFCTKEITKEIKKVFEVWKAFTTEEGLVVYVNRKK